MSRMSHMGWIAMKFGTNVQIKGSTSFLGSHFYFGFARKSLYTVLGQSLQGPPFWKAWAILIGQLSQAWAGPVHYVSASAVVVTSQP